LRARHDRAISASRPRAIVVTISNRVVFGQASFRDDAPLPQPACRYFVLGAAGLDGGPIFY
jgi:hypothetical protein